MHDIHRLFDIDFNTNDEEDVPTIAYNKKYESFQNLLQDIEQKLY